MIMSSHNPPLDESIQTQTQTTQPSHNSQESKPHHHKPFSAAPVEEEEEEKEEGGRERLKRHRMEMAGRVWIPDMWGHEDLLKDWIDCTAFDASLVTTTILMARDSLAQQQPNT